MRLQILNARVPSEAARWQALHQTWPDREVFAHPAYVRLFTGERDEPLAAYAETASGFILYPFVLRPVDSAHLVAAGGAYADITSPYGYGGAFQHAATDVEAKEFWALFDDFCRTRRVVSEFTRLSLFDADRLGHPGQNEPRLMNVVRDLRIPIDDIWREFDHKVRKNVNKARRSGITVEADPTGAHLDDFLHIYRGTMDRRHADAGYYFPRDFFARVIDELPGQFVFLHARHDGRIVSTELVLVSARTIYSYLGGTERAAFALRPNDLLKFEIIRWGQAQGKARFVLGGGYAPDDGIFRYKRAFAPGGLMPYSVGKRVLDEQAYHRLLTAHQQEGRRRDPAWRPDSAFFPEYRQALPVE